MRFGTIFALLFSVVIIGLALWWRFSDTKPAAQAIYSVNNQQPDDYEAALLFFTTPADELATTTASEPEVLTESDIISRNMLLSYLGVAIGNENLEKEDLDKVAEHYLNQAVGLHNFEKVGAESLKMVADNESNARAYAQGFANIYAIYADRMSTLFTNISTVNLQQENAYLPFVEPVVSVYSELAGTLKALPVPVSLSLIHLELINIYLSNAAAMREAKEINIEPMTTLSGLVAIKENGARESALLAELREVFISKWGEIE